MMGAQGVNSFYNVVTAILLIVTILPSNARVRNVGRGDFSVQPAVNEQSSIFIGQGGRRSRKVPERDIVKYNVKRKKVKADAVNSGGTVIMTLDTQNATVVSFEYEDDVAAFSSLGYTGDMEIDPPRFFMRSRKRIVDNINAKFNYEARNLNTTFAPQNFESLFTMATFPDLDAVQEIP
jgi:hypothetical protein